MKLIALMLAVLCLSLAAARDGDSEKIAVLLVSDLHFDPFFNKKLVPRLLKEEPAKWKALFESGGDGRISSYGQDTSYALLAKAFEGMAAATPRPSLVLISGDFFAHHFCEKLRAVQRDATNETCAAVMVKTMRFLADSFRRALPNAQLLPTLGNDDSPYGNYSPQPGRPYLKEFARAWQLPSGFAALGHYTQKFKPAGDGPGVRLIVLNDVYGSQMHPGGEAEGKATLAFLEHELDEAEKAREPVWIVEHIPVGIDIHKTITRSGAELCQHPAIEPLDYTNYTAEYVKILSAHADRVRLSLTGHTHTNEFRVYPTRIPTLIAPSISPIYANNPGFNLLILNRASLAPDDLLAYALPLDTTRLKWAAPYSFREEYQLPDMSFASLSALGEKLERDEKLKAKFIAHLTGKAPGRPSRAENWSAYLCSLRHPDTASFLVCACPKAAPASVRPR